MEASGRLLVVEGVGRLTRIDASGGAAATIEVVADALPGPASVAVVDRDAWIVETQLVHLTDPTSGPPDLPFRVERVPLEAP